MRPVTRLAERLNAAARERLADGGAALPAWPILGVLCLASAVTMVVLGTRLTFFNDEWYLLLQRPGFTADSLFNPHNEHLIALLVVIYKGLIAVFGFGSQLPYRVLLAAVVVALAIGVFLFVRERAGNLLALLAAAMLLFFGPAWEDLLWSFQIGFIGSLAAGVGVLVVMERDTPARNLAALGLLLVASSLSDLGLPFVAAAAVAVLLRRRPAQLWIPAVPAVLFAVWFLAYGHKGHSDFSLANVRDLPLYALDSIASGVASLTGLAKASHDTLAPYDWGRPLLALALAATAVWLYRGGRPPRGALVVGAAALSFWLLAGANYKLGREPLASRYQLVSGTFLILVAAEFFRPIRLRPGALLAVTAVVLVAIASNIGSLISGYNFLHTHSLNGEADIGALEIARGQVPGVYQLQEGVAHDDYLTGITAGAYFRESDAHGTPPLYSPDQIAAASPDRRQAVDNVLAAGYRMFLAQRPARARAAASGCRRLNTGFGGEAVEAELKPGTALITNLGDAPLSVAVRRFAPPGDAVGLGFLGAGYTAALQVRSDSVPVPWQLAVSGGAAFEVCSA
jgi:hypothetical protein